MIRGSPPAPYRTVSVSRLANYIANLLGANANLRWIGVQGEISGFTRHSSGAVYFDLKDRDALIRCVVWAQEALALPPLSNGQEVVAVGSVATFNKRSVYQLVVTLVESVGVGRLHEQYEALKRRLDAEGLFSVQRKRPLPRYPFRVALVSSRAANGAGDFLAQARVRAPHIAIAWFETPVQGAAAAPEIARAIDSASRADVDLVVVARGGGSYEDLFVFNDERVVRALARCAHPTVSAIGHEADTTLADFVADACAPTPSTAAQTVLPARAEMLALIERGARGLDRAVARVLERSRRGLDRVELRSPLSSPQRLFAQQRLVLDAIGNDLRARIDERVRARRARVIALVARLDRNNPSARLSERRERFRLLAYRLDAAGRAVVERRRRRRTEIAARLAPTARAQAERQRMRLRVALASLTARDPTAILQRGYAIVSLDGAIVRDAATVRPGATITARLAHGSLGARVETTDPDGGN